MRFLARIADFALVLLVIAAPPASAQTAKDLTGWWIAVDDAYHQAIRLGLFNGEELLIVQPDGRAEGRTMGFYPASHQDCLDRKIFCTNAPPVRTAKIDVNRSMLVFRDRSETAHTKSLRETERKFTQLSVIGFSPQWVISLTANGRRLQLDRGPVRRHFARIDPERLRRLRSAFLLADLSAARHWRCFFSNATAGDSTFDILGGTRTKPPAWFEQYVAAAATFYKLGILNETPTADDPDPKIARLAAMKVSNFMLPQKDNLTAPKTQADKRLLKAKWAAIGAMTNGKSEQQAIEAARKINPGFANTLPVTTAAAAALRKLRALAKRGSDPEVDRLFCDDGRQDPPAPRPEYDSFNPGARR